MVRPPVKLPKTLLWALGGLLLIGVVTFIMAARGPHRQRVWQIFLVNFLFWSGMAQGGLVFAAAYDLSQATWGEAVRRLAQGMGAFLPLSLLLFLLLFAGAETVFPWSRTPLPQHMTPFHPLSGKMAWLHLPFLFSRDLFGLLACYGSGLAYLYYTFRPEVGAAIELGEWRPPLSTLFSRRWRGLATERERSRRLCAVLTPLFVIVAVLVFSLLGFDLVMSLDPQFSSSLFGAYFVLSSVHLGLAATVIAAVLSRKPLALEPALGKAQFHDLGSLLFGFCLATGAFLWFQYVVIWYGNLPEETAYVIRRTTEMPWAPLAWAVLIVGFFGPAVILLSRWMKEHPRSLAAAAGLIVIGMWLERYLLVVPSLWHEPELPFGWLELLITFGFFAAFVLTYVAVVASLLVPSGIAETPDNERRSP